MTDVEIKKIPYPKGIYFVIGNVSFERFAAYGMRSILSLYLTDGLKYTEATAKIIYHTFNMLGGVMPLFAAVISDSWLGCFKVILFGSLIYLCGLALLPVSAIWARSELALLGLILIVLGNGSTRPCIIAFGGDQFILPQQEVQLAAFFSIIYFAVNAASLIGIFLTPLIRTEVHCFDRHHCYPLAFGVTTIMLVLALVTFIVGRPMYRIIKPKGNVLLNIMECICYALCNKKVENPGNSWLDRSQEKYGAKLVNDIKIVRKVLLMFTPLPFFWALFEQQGTGWTFMAVRMDGDIGMYTILPDQMQMFNPILVLALIPLFTYGVYPLFRKCHIMNTPLKKMCCGGFLAAVSFAFSAFLAMAIEATYPVVPGARETQVRIYDTTSCQYSMYSWCPNDRVNFSTDDKLIANAVINGIYVNRDVKIGSEVQTVNFTFTPGTTDAENTTCESRDMQIKLKEKTAYGIYINNTAVGSYEDRITKSNDGYPLVRTLTSDNSTTVTYTHIHKDRSVTVAAGDTELKPFPNVGPYRVEPMNQEVTVKLGGTYTVMINPEERTIRTVVVTNPNSVHILWLLPQYLVMAIGEIMFSITSLEFAYSQAPVSMKALLQGCYILTFAFGNLIIIVKEAIHATGLESNNFFLYCGLMVADMLLFLFLSIRYKYVNPEELQEPEEQLE